MRLLAVSALLGAAAARVGDQWGTNIHWTQETAQGEAAMLSQAFKVARMDFAWGSIEKTCGAYDFTAYDTLLATMQGAGVRPYWILDYSNPCYEPSGSPCKDEACFEAYGRLAAAAADHFQGHGIIWESVNEPNGMGGLNASSLTRMSLLSAASFSAKGEFWIGPTTAGMDFPYINATFADGILAGLSAVSVHPYRAGPPESAIDDYAVLRSLIVEWAPPGKKDLAIIGGEWGYTSALPPCAYGNRVDELTQAKYVARMWLSNAAAGVHLSIDYDWRDDGTNASDCESNFGSVHAGATGDPAQPYLPKDAFTAARTLQTTLGNAEVVTGRVPATVVSAGPTSALPIDVFVVGFSGIPGNSSSGGGTCPSEPTADCGFSGITPDQCTSQGCCFNDAIPGGPWCYFKENTEQGVGWAAWTNATSCPATPPPPANRSDCGYDGIDITTCTVTRRCCWDPQPTTGPQCFSGTPLANGASIEVSFPAFPAADGTCWSVKGLLGDVEGQVCAQGGAVAVNVSDSPVYIL
jgi:hypothetical protein